MCYNDNVMTNETLGKMKCSFIGHRVVKDSEMVASTLKEQIVMLIEEKGVNTFLFGSRSEFNDICHQVVTELREQYPYIDRIAYTCRSEYACMENDREKTEKSISNLIYQEVSLKGYEGEVEFSRKNKAGRASYVERNQAMIDDSQYCLFYYNEVYSPCGSGRSGTRIAYEYALKKMEKKEGKLIIIIVI